MQSSFNLNRSILNHAVSRGRGWTTDLDSTLDLTNHVSPARVVQEWMFCINIPCALHAYHIAESNPGTLNGLQCHTRRIRCRDRNWQVTTCFLSLPSGPYFRVCYSPNILPIVLGWMRRSSKVLLHSEECQYGLGKLNQYVDIFDDLHIEGTIRQESSRKIIKCKWCNEQYFNLTRRLVKDSEYSQLSASQVYPLTYTSVDQVRISRIGLTCSGVYNVTISLDNP